MHALAHFAVFVVAQQDLKQIENYASLALTIPDIPAYQNFLEGRISQRELMYLYSASRFAYYFLRGENDDYDVLHEYFAKDPERQKKLLSLGQSIGKEVRLMFA